MENIIDQDVVIIGSKVSAEDLATRLGRLATVIKGDATLEKVAKLAGRKIKQDAEFLKFLNAKAEDFDKKIPSMLRDEKVRERLMKVLNPPTDQEDFVPNVREVHNLLSVLTTDFVDVEVARKAKEYAHITDADVQAKVASQLALYKKCWVRAIAQSKSFKERYGVLV